LGKKTDNAISQLLRKSMRESNIPLRADRHKIKEDILLFKNTTKREDLKLDKIYIKKIKFKV